MNCSKPCQPIPFTVTVIGVPTGPSVGRQCGAAENAKTAARRVLSIDHRVEIVHLAKVFRRGELCAHSALGIDQRVAESDAFLVIFALVVLNIVGHHLGRINSFGRAPKKFHFLARREPVPHHCERISHVALNRLDLEQL